MRMLASQLPAPVPLPCFMASHDGWRLNDGTLAMLRPAGPDDAGLLQALVGRLSLTSRYRRFFYPIHELTPDLLKRFTTADPAHEFSLLAVTTQAGEETVLGMAQYVVGMSPGRCEFAVVVADEWHRNGIAERLMEKLSCVARSAGLDIIEGEILAENEPMRRLLRKLGFAIGPHPEGAIMRRASKSLREVSSPRPLPALPAGPSAIASIHPPATLAIRPASEFHS